jgi:hypothetical protein
MVQPSDFGNRHDRAHPGPLDGSRVGRILVERQECGLGVISVTGKDPGRWRTCAAGGGG